MKSTEQKQQEHTPGPHWRVRFMRRGMEPPYPFGKTEQIVCAATRDEAKESVPASSRYPITASKTEQPVGALSFCRCRAKAKGE